MVEKIEVGSYKMYTFWFWFTYAVVWAVALKIIDLVFKKIEKHSNAVHIRFLHDAILITLITVMIFNVLSRIEITKEIGSTILKSGSVALALMTFAAQKSLTDIISGFILSVSKSFKIGQKVCVNYSGDTSVEGTIVSLSLRQTVINSYDNKSYIVPNSILASSIIINYNLTDNVGTFIEVGITYDSDVDKAIETLWSIIKSDELFIDTQLSEPFVARLDESSVILKSTVHSRNSDDSYRACSNVRKQVLKQMNTGDVKLAFKTITIDGLDEITKNK